MSEALPVQRAVILSVRGEQGYAAADTAQGQGNPALACAGKARSNAIDQFNLDTLSLQPGGFFSTAAKDARVAAFEPRYAAALTGIAQHQTLDERLRCGAATAAFAHGDYPRLRAVFEDQWVDQVIDHDHVGLTQGAYRFERQQLRVARSRTN
ncbi:hypothetical protein D3C72_1427850 [compost metagenome]